MAINYTQAFNAGELSRNIDGRSDFEVYKVGCRSLENFVVLQQGGVERRAGTEFIAETGSDGSAPARLIPFDFSSDIKYVIELGTDYAKVHYTDANGADQVVDVSETDDIVYTTAELDTIQYNRRYDTLVLTCPTKETMVLKRTAITPTFTIENISYTYPPLQEQNLTSTNIDVGTVSSGDQYTGTVPLVASSPLFDSGHVGSHWAIDHIRATDKKDITFEVGSGSGQVFSDVLDASFSNWSFETSGTFNGDLILQRNVAGAGWETYLPIGDTSTGVARNFADASTQREGANTELRIAYTRTTGTMNITLSTDNAYHKGIVKITAVADSTNATATIVSQIQGGQANPDATVYWAEGAFSTYRGFAPASEFFENRLWFAGSKDQPADIFASQFGDIYNFLGGSLSTDAIKRTIDSPEEPKWLEGKRYLFLGTAETAVSIRSADEDALMTQSNITTLVENAYGSDPLQAEIANDVIVYVQRDGLKLRELVYNNVQDTFIGNDLNLISEDITESGIKEMFVQKTPNQFVWCIKQNGDACIMTYDRGQNVRGWARIETDGDFISAATIHNSGEDTVWACVKRTTGEDTPVIKYCIEKFHPRKDLNWYVDSGAEFQGTGSKSGDAVNDVVNLDHLKINITGHGYSTGDFVNIESSTYSNLTGNNFEVEKIDADNFYLRIIGTTTRIPIQEFVVSGTPAANGTFALNRGFGDVNDLQTSYVGVEIPVSLRPSQVYISLRWLVDDPTPTSSDDYFGAGHEFVWNATGSGKMLNASFSNVANRAITVKQINNKVTGLSHLEGKTVQVLVDDNYIADKVVASGTVTVDEYGTKVTAGLPYISKLQPMPIEPAFRNMNSQSRVKSASKVIVRFYKTKGAAVGEAGNQLTTYSVLDTQDSLGQALSLQTTQQRFFIASDYQREKLIEVRQDLPYPMTVLSIATHVNAEGS